MTTNFQKMLLEANEKFNYMEGNPLVEGILDSNKEEIIDALGGLQNVIHLCISNQNATHQIDEHKFQKLANIINSTSNNLNSGGVSSSNNYTKNNPTTTIISRLETVDNDNDNDNDHGHDNIAIDQSSQTQAITGTTVVRDDFQANTNYFIANNLSEYSSKSIVLNVYPTDCLLFTLLPKIRLFSYFQDMETLIKTYTILTNNNYLVIFASIIVISFIIGDTVYATANNLLVYYFFYTFGYFLGILLCISGVLIINITIFYLVIDTFDFWFKLFNVILFQVSYIVLGDFRADKIQFPVWYWFFFVVSSLFIFSLLFLIDTFNVPTKIKSVVRVLVAMFLFATSMWRYIVQQDQLWNPFETNRWDTSISFKSVYLSATFNLALFTLKPLLVRAAKRMCLVCKKRTRQDKEKDSQENDVEQFTSVLKRPYIKWQPLSVDDNGH